MYGYKDMSGLVFDKLTVSHQQPKRNENGELVWLCKCECGTEIYVRGYCLRRGQTKSCGCLRGENGRTDWTKHGLSRTPGYNNWTSMISRCYNTSDKDYPDYGGRGITVCDRWRNSVENFLLDMPPHPGNGYSLDRFNVDGDYSPGNCRWATAEMQANNQRRTILHRFQGCELTLAQIHRIDNSIPYSTLVYRVSQGYTVEEAYRKSVLNSDQE